LGEVWLLVGCFTRQIFDKKRIEYIVIAINEFLIYPDDAMLLAELIEFLICKFSPVPVKAY
jgi:hypothetical protein